MHPNIEQPPGVDPSVLTPEERELVMSGWLRFPRSVREEIAALWNSGWRWKQSPYGDPCLTHPDDDDVWVHFHPITFVKAFSAKRAWQVEEEAGRGSWCQNQ